MPNVWYAKCHEKAIAYLAQNHYLCTVILIHFIHKVVKI